VTLRIRHVLAVALAAAVVLGVLATPALAGTPSVTLSANPSDLVFGTRTTLSGHVTPWHRDQIVKIVDQDGHVIRRATTGTHGKYSVSIMPRRNLWLHAEWNDVKSPRVHVRVRPRVRVQLGQVLLFGTSVATGRVTPAHGGAGVEVTLFRGGRPAARAIARMNSRGEFRTRFTIAQPGTYRVRAAFRDADHALGAAVSNTGTTPLPSLRVGARGPIVRLLEQRLVALHYRLTGIDGRYDFRTADAVLAFRKVQRMARVFTVDPAVWRKLASPRRPVPRLRTKPRHVEVNQTLQVLYVVIGGKIAYIFHVSTGKPSTPTRDGSFRVWRKLAGFSGHHLYYPSYFDGRRAIHGWTEVPTYPASHGCVRIPYWVTRWMFTQDPVGTRVLVYH
jgi:peptidoglycan hydrolase-like protein with peptidoglycan-binding domain